MIALAIVDVASIFIVIGGLIASLLINFKMKQIKLAGGVLRESFYQTDQRLPELIALFIRYLIEENDYAESRFSAVGYGDTRPSVPNSSSENWRKNRRVEIVI